ncbi:peptidyl-alpha-hydroxyglycine alpha-amidating lyase 1 [Condylostylus longicornis]|uniref:peptidyl-alpha-hydroxyglycine alpha-amidating lyase 1 n=1 Tax=Condylostylus longicornis TaxID=2530218 RepID=UPI00244E37F2|nr:peptidyl-alpha-hydroxyglycine alpha-amidating lyase 1 [Condylostylus longicornis]
MFWSDTTFFISLLLVILPQSKSSENFEKLQNYFPYSSGDEIASKSFQQVMQGSSSSGMRIKEPKFKSDPIDVKTELEKLNTSHTFQPDWPIKQKVLGSVSAVTFDKAGNVIVFHRVDRIWNEATFNMSNYFMQQSLGAISGNTVVAFHKKTGKVLYEWGKNLFYMPHGLTIDSEDNVWVTDVALHQVMKFGPKGSNNKPQLILGTSMKPGHGRNQFCKPTSVAVLPDGDFFVADGYCNARIIKFSKSGEPILTWGHHTFAGQAYENAPVNFFAIPHALTLAPDLGLICVADRENGRVQCFNTNNCSIHSQYHSEIIGDRLFSVAYAPVAGGQLYVVNGPNGISGSQVNGFIIDMKTTNVIEKFVPQNIDFRNPHDIAVTADGSDIYIAELDPKRVLKFSSKKLIKTTTTMSSAKPTATIITDPNLNEVNKFRNITVESAESITNSILSTRAQPGSTALFLIVLVLMFGLTTFGIIVLISKRQKRGCSLFGKRNRRHAWDFPAGEKPFKLGNLINNDRNKRGFEKLNQNASDEEIDASTNMLTSAQFA